MNRKNELINNLHISFLDNEKKGPVLICLHGHFGTASNLSFMDGVFDGRVVIPDLRGQGLSEHATSYAIDDYVLDLETLIASLAIENPIILGHSLGGIIAIKYTAKQQHVNMLIVEDIGTEIQESNEFLRKFPTAFKSVYEVDKTFKDVLKRPLSTYFMESLYYDTTAWKFRFGYEDMIQSQNELNGNYWPDWEKLKCPVLLMKGGKSWASNKENMEEMAKRNKMAKLIIYPDASHGIHDDEREKFCKDVCDFIAKHNK